MITVIRTLLILFVLVCAFLLVVQYEQRLDRLTKDVVRLEIQACGWTQFEDYSVAPRADDQDRRNCVGFATGEVRCDRIVRSGHEYVVNCREPGS